MEKYISDSLAAKIIRPSSSPAEEETGAKITRKMQTDKTGVNGADPTENQTPSYSAEVELKGMK